MIVVIVVMVLVVVMVMVVVIGVVETVMAWEPPDASSSCCLLGHISLLELPTVDMPAVLENVIGYTFTGCHSAVLPA